MTREELMLCVRDMAQAAARFVDPRHADELARAVAQVAKDEPDYDFARHVYRIACELLAHRMISLGLRCSEPIACAEAMAKAWNAARKAAA